MAVTAGKNLVIKVCTTLSGTYYTIGSANDASMSLEGDNQDITAFGENYINRIQGLKDVSYSVSGFYDSADTNGQTVIKTALINDSALYVQFLPDGTNGWKQAVKVSSFEISGSVDGVVEFSVEFEGSDDITAVP